MKNQFIVSCLLIILLVSTFTSAYERGSNTPTHEYITNESQKVWPLIPNEITNHLTTSFDRPIDGDFDEGDDIITGSAEEDHTVNPRRHFWDPDSIDDGDYNDGILGFESSYRRATGFWETRVIPAYLRGDLEESYYWLGRTSHLLEDAAQPSHVHLDPHTGHLGDGSSVLEDWAGENYAQYAGEDYAGEQYYYEHLINNFEWSEVQPTRTPDRHYSDFFRLFWHTAQKTQYWPSDNRPREMTYTTFDDTAENWACSGTGSTNLWVQDGYVSCTNFLTILDENNVEQEADATIPHTMKATAGLYRLFWDTVHSYEWPFLHHDLHRTSATILKGNIRQSSDIRSFTYNLQSGVTESEETSRIGIANLESEDIFALNGENEVIVTTDNGFGSNGGKVHVLHANLLNNYVLDWEWSFPTSFVGGAPSVENFDTSDDDKEFIFGLRNGTMFAMEGPTSTVIWSCSVPIKYSAFADINTRGRVASYAIADIDLDGTKEIIFTDSQSTSLYDWPGELYIFSEQGSTTMSGCGSKFKLEKNVSLGNPGSFDPPSIANVDSDDYSEIIVPSYYNLSVWDYNGNTLSLKWSTATGLIDGTIAVYDIDKDNQYEIIYTTTTEGCASAKSSICENKLWVRNANTGTVEWSTSLSIYSRVGPAIADLDYDGDYEVVITGHTSAFDDPGKIIAYDGDNGAQVWSFDDSGTLGINYVGVSLADIDGNGKYNVIFPNNASKLFILNENGATNITKTFSGQIGSAPAIGMISRNGIAEIALKHAGSPITNITFITGSNDRPTLNALSNRTAHVGLLFDVNTTGEVLANDTNGDNLTFIYGYPLNGSGFLNATTNDTGSYEVLVEVTDGELSDWQYFTLRVVERNISVESFTDIYSNNTREVIEGIIVNNFNETASQVGWNANVHETAISSTVNTSIDTDEEITILIEYNYSLYGWKTVSLAAFDTTKGLNDSFNASIFVGPLRVENLSGTRNGTHVTFTFDIYTLEENNLTNINWTLDTGVAQVSATSLLNISAYSSTEVNASYEYPDSGNYTVEVLVWNSINNDTDITTIEIPDITIDDHELLYQQDNTTVISFSLTNELSTNMSQVSWQYNTGEETINAQTNLSLSPQETVTIIIEKQYATYGEFLTTANVTDGSHLRSSSLSISIVELLIENFQKLTSNGTLAVYEFTVRDEFTSNKTFRWRFDTNDTGILEADTELSIYSQENVTVLVQYNHTSTGNYTVFAGANTTNAAYTEEIEVIIQ